MIIDSRLKWDYFWWELLGMLRNNCPIRHQIKGGITRNGSPSDREWSQTNSGIESPGATRRRQGVERAKTLVIFGNPFKTSGAKSIWQLITPKSSVYEKDFKLYIDSPSGLWFAIRYKSIEALRKTCEKRRVSPIFHGALVNFYCIANQKLGGESTYSSTPFSYTSLFGMINCQILNCLRSFDGICKDD